MLIKYIWFDEPDNICVFDTKRAYRNTPNYFLEDVDNQEEFDNRERKMIAEKHKLGLVLRYWIEE